MFYLLIPYFFKSNLFKQNEIQWMLINCALYYASITVIDVFFLRSGIAIWRLFDFQWKRQPRFREDSRPSIKTPHTVNTAVRCLSTLWFYVCGEVRCSCYYTGHGITVSWSVMFITAADLIPAHSMPHPAGLQWVSQTVRILWLLSRI